MTNAAEQGSRGMGKDLIVYVCILALAGIQFVIAYQDISASQMFVRMLIVAMDAAAELEKEGISAEVVDMRALRPLDMAPVVESVKKTSRLITVEEGWRSYGVGSEIASRVYEEAFDYLDAPVARIGAAEVPAPYNKRLEKIAFPGKADVIVTARALLGKN